MKHVVLFSSFTASNTEKLLKLIFPKELENKVFAYLPSDGILSPREFTELWEGRAKEFGAEFLFIDNTKEGLEAEGEVAKLERANILLITGGNTFSLLNYLHRSGLDEAIKRFAKKPEFVIAGFSAGALVLCPSIELAGSGGDGNTVGITDLHALGLVTFEVLPHFTQETKGARLREYRKRHPGIEVKPLTNDAFIVIDK